MTVPDHWESCGAMEGRIRLAVPDDAAALLVLQQRLDRQSFFMLLEPDARAPNHDVLRCRLGAQRRRGAVATDSPEFLVKPGDSRLA